MTIFPRFDIKAPDGTVYLRRWTLLKVGEWFKVMVHKMERPDYARELHDHPWPFVTIVLKGGYVEQYYLDLERVTVLAKRHNYPGTVRFNSARHSHVVSDLPRGTCWTLVFRGRRKRVWGFYTRCGWMNWRKYTDRMYAGDPICEEGE